MKSKEIKSQARRWFIRMQSSDIQDHEKKELSNWLLQDIAHQEFYQEIENKWNELDRLESWAREEVNILEQGFNKSIVKQPLLLGVFGMVAGVVIVIALMTILPIINQGKINQFETMRGEQRRIVLSDGSRIHLNSASSVIVRFTEDSREIVLIHGEGLFDVAHERNRPFVVKVRESKVVAIGTSFNIYYTKDEIAVTVVEGRVAILPAHDSLEHIQLNSVSDLGAENATVLLESNRQVRVNEMGEVSPLVVVDAEKVTAWDRGMLVLDNTPLREVAEELSRYVVGNIKVAHGVPDYPVTGVIKIRDQETMLRLLSEVVPVFPIRQSAQVTMLFPSEKEEKQADSY